MEISRDNEKIASGKSPAELWRNFKEQRGRTDRVCCLRLYPCSQKSRPDLNLLRMGCHATKFVEASKMKLRPAVPAK